VDTLGARERAATNAAQRLPWHHTRMAVVSRFTVRQSAGRSGPTQGGGSVIPNDKEIPEPHYSFVPQHCTHLVPVLALLGWVHDDRKS
jgi:hypothetical protein